MKRLIRLSILSSLLVFMVLAGCQNRNTDDSEKIKGEPTVFKMSLRIPKANTTYATTDANATEDEAKLVTADIFIYEPPTGILVQHHSLVLADFTQTPGTDVYVTNTPLASTTGEKIVMVGLNLPAAIKTILSGGDLSDVRNIQDITIADATSVANGFAMYSQFDVTAIFVPDATASINKVIVPVKRLASKITLERSATMEIVNAGGTLMPDISFVARNSNRKVFYLQQLNLQDPNWASGSWVATDFEQGGEDAGAPGYILIDDAGISDPKLLSPQYAIENTSEDHLQKETTYASVRGEFIPEAVYEFANGTDATGGFTLNSGHGIVVPQTFYQALDAQGHRFFFFDQAVAIAYNTAELADYLPLSEYTDGYCYWNMFLNPTGVPTAIVPPYLNAASPYDVLRNSYYKATITKIYAPGNATPLPTRPDEPVEQETNIEVSVDVLFWELVGDDYVLKP